jgi:hypothetical protein
MAQTKRKTQRRKTQRRKTQRRRAQRGGDIGGRNIPEDAVFTNPMKVGKDAGGVELG